ncbi:MAG: TIGR03087 family PEP-CTERM/XrtA system glycosyltransferase [Gemmataceae bacterium]
MPKPDLLFLVHRFPFPPDKGDRIRTYHLLRFLSTRARVHLACLSDEPVSAEHREELASLCAQLEVVPLGTTRWLHAARSWLVGRSISEGAFQSRSLRTFLRTWVGQTSFAACLVSMSSMVPYLDDVGPLPVVVDLVDVDSEKWREYARQGTGPRRWFYATEARRLRQLEQGLPARVRAVTLVSEAEAELYRQFAVPGNIQAVPNGVDLDCFQPAALRSRGGQNVIVEETRCLFVGALDYRPNVDGIAWFCREVWPGVQARQKDARLAIVGRRPVAAVRELEQLPGVEVMADVPDVRPELARAAVVVAPLWIARGIQNKVLEALAAGKAVVASPPALAGLQARPGEHLLSADKPAEWIDKVTGLFASLAERERLGQAGRAFVEANHRWESCLQKFAELLDL